MQPERKSAVEITFPPPAPGCGQTVRLTVTTPRKTMEPKIVDQCEYLIDEVQALPGERAFRFDRLDLDRPETWFVRVAGRWMECTCQAGTLARVP